MNRVSVAVLTVALIAWASGPSASADWPTHLNKNLRIEGIASYSLYPWLLWIGKPVASYGSVR